MSRFLFYFLYFCTLLAVLNLTGCASAPPQVITVPISRPCPSAIYLPAEPARALVLDETKPGEAVQAYTANRAEWVGYGDQLRIKLEACRK